MARERDPKTGRFIPSNPLKYPSAVYNPEALKTLQEAEVRKEYQRLRSIAQKRGKRISESEWGTDPITGTASRQWWKFQQLPRMSELTPSELRANLSNIAQFLSSDTSSVSGLNAARDKALATLHRHDKEGSLLFITKENFSEFGRFMEYAREQHLGRMYDSDRVAKWWAENKKANPDEDIEQAFYKWLEKETRPEAPLHHSGGATSSGVYRA